MTKRFFQSPRQEYISIFLAITALAFDFFVQNSPFIILTVALLCSLPVLTRAFLTLLEWGLSIDILHLLALVALFAAGEMHLIVFVGIVLAMGHLLDLHIDSALSDIFQELRRQIPKKAFRQNRNVYDEIPVERVRCGDILIVKEKEKVPVDGVVVFGEAYVDESSVTGELALVKKMIGDKVFSPSVISSGTIKIRAISASRDSMFLRKAEFMKKAGKGMSSPQYLAGKLAEYFLPFVFIAGIAMYLATDNIIIVAALFLVVCEGGVAVVVPFTFKKVFNTAAKYGVLIKSYKKFEALGKIKTIVFNKTDTLIFGSFQIKDIHIEESISKTDFWTSIAIAEKYSEDPVNKILFREAVGHVQTSPDAHKYQVYKGAGVCVQYGRDNIIVGNKKLLAEKKIILPRGLQKKLEKRHKKYNRLTIFVAINDIFVGFVTIVDIPQEHVRASVEELHKIGIEKIIILTGDNETIAQNTASTLGIDEFRFALTPEEKRAEIERLSKINSCAVVGSSRGNDLTFLRSRDVYVAMGKDSAAISSDSPDIIILNDDLRLLPKLILSSRESVRVAYGNIGIWFMINALGVAFVFTGIITPVFAVLYSFITNFTHIFLSLGSTRIFKAKAK